MATETSDTTNGNAQNANGDVKRSPGKDLMSTGGIAFIIIYLFGAIIIVMLALIVLWPPIKPSQQANASPTPTPTATPTPTPTPPTGTQARTPIPTATPTPSPRPTATPTTTPAPGTTAIASPTATPNGPEANRIKGEFCLDEEDKPRKGVSPWHFGSLYGCMYDEDRLLLIVLLAGAFGSLIHGLRSFVWYVGNRRAVWSWSAYYFALPFIGSGLAFIFYLVIRGGFFSPNASVELTSPVGFAAVAALIGMFTEQAVQKLKGVSETILSPAEKGKDHIGGLKISGIAPKQGPSAGGNQITIAGENFSTPVTVKFGTAEGTVAADSNANSITVTVPPQADPTKPRVDVVVINNDGQQSTERDGYEYKDPPGGSTAGASPGDSDSEQPVSGEGGGDDAVDGCDVKLKPDTPDEALPITEGGVE